MTHPDPHHVALAQQALEPVIAEWMTRSGVISIEVARRWRDGRPSDEVGIRVVLERLLPRDEVPEGELFPNRLDDIAVDVVEGRFPELEVDEGVSAPDPPG